jgi:hypothetical protein
VGSPLRWLLGLLVALHVLAAVVVGVTTDWAEPGFTTGDSLQYKELTGNHGVPYRDYEVAFPPLTWAFVELVELPDDPSAAGRLLVLTQLVADLAVAAALAYGWSRRGGVAWLVLLLPLCWGGWIFARIDLLSVALAMWGLALARRRREADGGLLVALGVFAKAWPVLTLPGLWAEARYRALKVAIGVLAAGGLLWLLVGGLGGFQQVLTFRGARGYHVESTVGSVLLMGTEHEFYSEAGALRIASQPEWAKYTVAGLLVAGVTIAWVLGLRAARRLPSRATEAAILGSLVAVGLLLVLSPLLSPQYLVWLLPFVALRWRDTPLVATVAGALVLTAWVASHYEELIGESRRALGRLIVLRNGLLVIAIAIGMARLLELATRRVSAPDAACTARRTRR